MTDVKKIHLFLNTTQLRRTLEIQLKFYKIYETDALFKEAANN